MPRRVIFSLRDIHVNTPLHPTPSQYQDLNNLPVISQLQVKDHSMPLTNNVPLLYRLFFLYIEPIGALVGALQAHFTPTDFLVTFIQAPPIPVQLQHQIVFDQLAATYFLFAFNEAVVLRSTHDLRVWKTIILGILICDLIHLYGSYCALGPEVFWNPLLWRWYDAVNLGMLWGPGGLRLAFLLGVGLEEGGKEKVKA